jgi:hypothetical protein
LTLYTHPPRWSVILYWLQTLNDVPHTVSVLKGCRLLMKRACFVVIKTALWRICMSSLSVSAVSLLPVLDIEASSSRKEWNVQERQGADIFARSVTKLLWRQLLGL